MHLMRPAPDRMHAMKAAMAPVSEELTGDEEDDHVRHEAELVDVHRCVASDERRQDAGDERVDDAAEDEEDEPLQDPPPDLRQRSRGEQPLDDEQREERRGEEDRDDGFHVLFALFERALRGMERWFHPAAGADSRSVSRDLERLEFRRRGQNSAFSPTW